ncbi:MAG: hypothetical protein COT92_02045 [Candidatus Doudnabacteria bacterium CG10_big_fil_rev_8_21_14_0_10_42_18]|uniref:Uncharacterized protein n=1 Tax=Candidatus Doudnabacteria bacterium CG10_big_fil_rev_8_21_14_0_10_42_18 TaxID=1974552 RepID=A0A2H0VD24_9BACT|nr:MAG: hypothetical protein COT92_02045 [Candidatus Doudnabacteria bacterium CG10_big_fil_rev_8_21_14_0_10_42_18]
MNWLEKVRKKPHTEKIRLIWILIAAVVIILIGIWIGTARIKKNVSKDTTLFKAIDQGINDVIGTYKN